MRPFRRCSRSGTRERPRTTTIRTQSSVPHVSPLMQFPRDRSSWTLKKVSVRRSAVKGRFFHSNWPKRPVLESKTGAFQGSMFTDKYMGSTTQTVDSFVLDLKTPSQKPGIFFLGGGCRLPPLLFALGSEER